MSAKMPNLIPTIKDPRVALTTEGVTKPDKEARYERY